MSEKYIQNVALFADIPIMQQKNYDKNKLFNKYTIAQLIDSTFSDPAMEAWASEFNENKYGRNLAFLNGLGAYKVTSWEDKQRIELTRKEKHWTSKLTNPTLYDQAYPEKIVFNIVIDETALRLELKNQKIDASCWVSTVGLTELQKDDDFNRNYYSEFLPNYNYQYLGMNLKPQLRNRPHFFTDVRVRKAIAKLVPVDMINATFYNNRSSRMASMVSPIKKDVYNNDLKLIAVDVEGAKQLLDEAGWKDLDGDGIRDKLINGQNVKFEFELLYSVNGPIIHDITKTIADAFKKAGLQTNLRGQEFSRYLELVQSRDFDMTLAAWNGSFYIDDYKQIWHSSSWENKGSNHVGFGTPESDRLIDEIRKTTNDSLRIVKEKKLQEIIYNEQPYIFLFTALSKVVIHKRFANNDMYYEKPGIYLSNLRLNNGSIVTTAIPN
jgi:peptide/nickel transport system substrate-binding protein